MTGTPFFQRQDLCPPSITCKLIFPFFHPNVATLSQNMGVGSVGDWCGIHKTALGRRSFYEKEIMGTSAPYVYTHRL